MLKNKVYNVFICKDSYGPLTLNEQFIKTHGIANVYARLDSNDSYMDLDINNMKIDLPTTFPGWCLEFNELDALKSFDSNISELSGYLVEESHLDINLYPLVLDKINTGWPPKKYQPTRCIIVENSINISSSLIKILEREPLVRDRFGIKEVYCKNLSGVYDIKEKIDGFYPLLLVFNTIEDAALFKITYNTAINDKTMILTTLQPSIWAVE